jgi:Formate hydrogenlyase subunit 6/NADH:ubiquinone oxidoreductase 23 kD subunit (chain I)
MPKMVRTVFKSLFKKPSTLMYPSVSREWQERTRGHIRIETDTCILCAICAKKCPTEALIVDKQARTWTMDRMRCVQCGNCVQVCPKNCLYMEQSYAPPSTKMTIYTADIPKTEKATDEVDK